MAGAEGLSSAALVLTLAAASMGGPALADRPEPGPEIVVLNHSHQAIDQLYVSPTDSDQWGENRLGNDSVHPGGSFRLHLPRTIGCNVDVQVVYRDARQEERDGENICRAARVSFDAERGRDAARGGGACARRDRVQPEPPGRSRLAVPCPIRVRKTGGMTG